MSDRYDDEARRFLLAYDRRGIASTEGHVRALAAALREAEQRGAREMRERAAAFFDALAAHAHAHTLGAVERVSERASAYRVSAYRKVATYIRALPIDGGDR